MARSSSLRASDADRDAVAERSGRPPSRAGSSRTSWRIGCHRPAGAHLRGARPARRGPAPAQCQRSRPAVPAGGVVLAIAVRIAVLLVVVAALMVAFAVTAAWWLLALIVWLTLRAGT